MLLCSFASADAESDYKLLFGEEEAKILARRNSKEIAVFAAKLLNAAKTVSGQKPLQNLLCEKAYEFALRDASGYETAVEAAKLQMEADPAKKPEAREKLAKVLQLRFARSSGEERKTRSEELVDLLITGADELAQAAKPAEAADAYRQALSIATAARSDRAREIIDKVRAVNDAVQAEKNFAALKASLAADPKNTTTRTTLILIYLGEKDDPAEAAKLVTPDLDERLRTYVPLAAKPVADLEENACLELAAWYVEIASKLETAKKIPPLARAQKYAERYLALHEARDVDRLKAQMLFDTTAKNLKELRDLYGNRYEAIRKLIGEGAIVKTNAIGGPGGGGGPFIAIPPAGAVLVGFKICETSIVKSLQPIYLTEKGKVYGKTYGITRGTRISVVEAKPGYAVAALVGKESKRLNGLTIVFAKMIGTRLDLKDSYDSKWYGSSAGNDARAEAGEARLVVGVHGSQGEDVDNIGLVYLGSVP